MMPYFSPRLLGVCAAAALVTSSLSLAWAAGTAARERAGTGASVGQHPPDFSSKDLAGTRHNARAYDGDVVVLHFWATWCPFCQGEMPKLTELHERYSGEGVKVLAVSEDESLVDLKTFIRRESLSYPVIADIQQTTYLSELFEVAGVPTTLIIGRDGRIAARFDGPGDLIGAVKQALKTKPAPAQP